MAVKDKAQLAVESASTFADNTTRNITPSTHRTFNTNFIDSVMTTSDNFIDEDDFASNSATKAPSQQSTKAYVDTQVALNINGIQWKESARVATNANITLSGTQTIDGIGVVAGNRVLVKNQTTATENGIYVVAAGAWTRATDADATIELQNAVINIDEGTNNGDTTWRQVTDNVTVGSSSIVWSSYNISTPAAGSTGYVQFNNGGTFDADASLVWDNTNKRLGIGTSSPNGSLQFGSTTGNRKIVLYENANNDHEYYGFGINSSTLRFQIPEIGGAFRFYSGTSSSTSSELFSVSGMGKVVINTTPSNDNALTQILARDSSTGEVKHRTYASFASGSSNELQKNNGSGFGGTGLYSSTEGNLTLGGSSTTGTSRQITAAGTETNITLDIRSKGTGSLLLSGGSSGVNLVGSEVTITGDVLDIETDYIQMIRTTTPPASLGTADLMMYAQDSSDGTATLALRLSQAVEAIGTFTASHKLKIRINGTQYWIQLDQV